MLQRNLFPFVTTLLQTCNSHCEQHLAFIFHFNWGSHLLSTDISVGEIHMDMELLYLFIAF